MSVPVVYLPEAEDDIDAAYQWHEQQRTGLGDRFLTALRDAVERLQGSPCAYAILRSEVRAVVLTRFPYVVYYRFRGDHILVIAVLHGRRSSRIWRKRL